VGKIDSPPWTIYPIVERLFVEVASIHRAIQGRVMVSLPFDGGSGYPCPMRANGSASISGVALLLLGRILLFK
jgi:hypothetical protein